MTSKNNIILHCQEGSSDKIYIWSVRKSNAGWDVIGKWGRRGRNVSEQNKGSFKTKDRAKAEARDCSVVRQKKGYVDIESSEYDGPLTRESPEVKKYLESEGEGESKPVAPIEVNVLKSREEPMPKLKDGEVCVATCLDNIGIEGSFDVGIDYIVEDITKGEVGQEMIQVVDSNGVQVECYRNRFGKYKVE